MPTLPFKFVPRPLALAVVTLSLPLGAKAAEDARMAFFEAKIRPVLVERCYECHAAETKQKGGLLLDSKSGWMIGGDSGAALVPGDPEHSLLMRAVSYEEPDLQMPPKKRLSPTEIADLRQWILDGAFDPRQGDAEVIAKATEMIDIPARKAEHWAWQSVSRPPVPEVENRDWSRADSDRFILAKLEAAGISPNAMAADPVIVRRLFFDLTGLPPKPEQVKAFLTEPSEVAYEQLVDELLESPHFGERWGQHWLDLVRFAETWGHEQDYAIPEAWRYRDYVVRALNADLPYDDFLVEHIAGDLVQNPRIDPELRTNESIQGTGFWHLGEATHSPVDIRDDECTRVSNQIDVFSKAFLGLTVMCARCHDHKFDAISTKDYYALFGYLQSSNYQLADVADPPAQKKAFQALKSITAEEDMRLRRLWLAAYRNVSANGEIDWTQHLDETAKDDPSHPLFMLGQVAQATDLDSFNEQLNKIRRGWSDAEVAAGNARRAQFVVRTERQGELHLTDVKEPFEASRHIIADYGDPSTGWYVSGHRFGDGPRALGRVRIAFNAENESQPRGLVLESAAHADHLSERLTGMIRTKTFKVVGNRLWYRYRGKAKVFLAVDSHRVCQGPLHSNRLRMELKGGDDYRWASHDVSKYIGHRVHVEFSPGEGFSLSRVQFGHEEPPPASVGVDERLQLLLLDRTVDSIDALNAKLNEVFDKVLSEWAQGEPVEADAADLVEWLVFRSGVIDPTKTSASERSAMASLRADAARMVPKPIRALALMDGSAENEPVHVRGNYRTLSREPVPRGFLEALAGTKGVTPAKVRDGSGRMELAKAVVSPNNPLTARVFVNRVWHHLLGRGIVETVDNFGATGAPPSHPELLDHLAYRFVEEHDWSLKQLVRELVLSATYRMSSQPDPAKTALDPTNRWWHRMPVRRLTSEAIRDHLLSVSGRLDPKLYGKSVMVHISDFMRNNRSPGGSGPLDGDGRRSIYVEGRRNHMEPLLVAFDKPTPFTAIGRRNVSSSPSQPLILLNNALVHQEAERWAKRLLAEERLTDAERLENAYWTAFSRPPEAWESEIALTFLDEQRALHPGDHSDRQAWTDLAHTLINVKEFIFIN